MNIYIVLEIIISSIMATVLMTLFSYGISAGAREVYKEPILLAHLLTNFKMEVSAHTKKILGWLLHFMIGFAFVIAYYFLWKYDVFKITWTDTFILGAISGVIGIVGWMVMFAVTDKKPNIDFKGYYAQLFVAHLIFTLTAFLIHQLFI